MKRIKKSVAIFLAVIMTLSALPAAGLTAFAFEADEPLFILEEIINPIVPEGYYLTGRTNVDENDNTIYHIEEINPVGDIVHEMWIDINGNEVQNPDYPLAYPLDEKGEQVLKGDILPSKYDARDYGLITPVEYQVGGTCWAHAGVAIIESAYLKKFGKTYDLSEYHTAWFGKNSYYSGETASGNDGVTKTDVIGVLNDGGNMYDVSRAMSNFSGGVLESRYPFNTEDHSSCLEDTELIVEMQNTFTYDTRYHQDVILEGIKTVSYDISALKQAVLDYGTVQIAYYSDDAYYNYKDSNYRGWYVGKYQDDFQVAFYHPTMSDTNHAVTLVGWDDSFSRENFGTYKPENDGAWLVKNSWSTDWGNDGYFWISYEDKSIQAWPSYVAEVGDVNEYEDVYLYDGIGYSSYTNACTAAANIFTAENDIYLSKISYGSTATRDYTLKIYKGLAADATDPTAGTLVLEQSGNTYGEKYISLEGDVKLNKGDRFSVVLEMDYIYYEGTGTNKTCNSGDSFYYKDASWVDATETTYGNACIRAIAKFQEEIDTYKVTFKDGNKYSETVTATNGVVTLPEKEGHTYVLTYNGTDFDGTGITQDITVNTHCYPTDGTISKTNNCTTEYKCIYCGEEMKDSVTNHDYTVTVVPATVKTIGYTFKDCKNCTVEGKSDYTLYEGADGGEATVGSSIIKKKIWWQYIDGNLCVFPTALIYKMPDFASSSETPWVAYLDEITTVTVGEKINYLGDYMFSDLPALIELNLTDDITEIGDYCFSGAKALKEFDCPEALTKIGTYAFNGAISLEEIDYNDAIKTLGKYAYNGCTSLTEVVIPGTVTSVGTYLFYGCSSVEKITVEEGVTFVPYLVWNNSVLKEIVLPSTLTNAYFMNYTALEKYTVSPDNKVYCSVGGVVYSKDMKTLYAYPATKAGKYFAVPDSVEDINQYAFSFLRNLKYLDMSSCAVTSVVTKAFNQMQSVFYVNLPETLTEIQANGFYQTRMSNLFVPSTVTSIDSGAFNVNGSTYYKIPSFYTDSEAAKIKEIADANSYTCTVVHTAHDFSTTMTDMSKDPTCKDEGTSLKTCVCGKFEYKTVPATDEHSFVKGETTAPTCTDGGYTTYTCSACGVTSTGDETTALGHTEVTDAAKAPTCEGTGLTEGSHCSVCGEVIVAQTTVAATGHSYTDKVTAPTCTEEGYTTYTCSACGDTYKADIVDAKDHSYTSKVTAPTCTEEGYTTYICSACGDTYTGNETAALGHTEVTDAAKAPTCEGTGLTEGLHCSVCSEILVEQMVVSATGHTEVTDAAVAATCTGTGLTEGKHCGVCGEVLVAQTVVDALGHSHKAAVTAPTCTKGGYTTYTCACGDTYTADETAATGHNHKAVVTAPTCTKGGYTTYTCACGDTYTADETVATGHNHKAAVTAPTCTKGGYTTYTCACGDTYTADETAATGHSHKTAVTAPTCTKDGYTTYTCACGDTYTADKTAATGHTEVTDAAVAATCEKTGLTEGKHCGTCSEILLAQKETEKLAHSYTASVTAPTCSAKGYTTYTCGSCGYSYKGNETAKTEHKYTVTSTEATCTYSGYAEYICKNCSYSYTEKTADAKGHSYVDGVCSECGDKKVDNCSCNCHKSGFAGFIWKILRFFYKLFKMHPVCDCGVSHY